MNFDDQMLWIDAPDAENIAVRKTDREDLLEHFRSFRENGYAVVRNAIEASLCDRARRAFFDWCVQYADAADAALRPDGFHHRLINSHLGSDDIAGLFATPGTALEVLDFLFGARASVYTSLYFERGTEQPIHIDLPVFFTQPENCYFGVWFALEDADETNGALQVAPGGHRLALPDRDAIARAHCDDLTSISPGGNGLWVPYQNQIQRSVADAGIQPVAIPVRKGDVIIWHPLLPHGGGPITAKRRSRHSMVFHVVPEGVPVYQADVFFNKDAPRPATPRWQYRDIQNRKMAVVGKPAFGDN